MRSWKVKPRPRRPLLLRPPLPRFLSRQRPKQRFLFPKNRPRFPNPPRNNMAGSNGTPITSGQIQELREATGAGIMDCKKALEESHGNMEKAKAWLRDRGVALAAKKGGRMAKEGLIGSYIHAGGKLGVLVELNSETDFVARTEDFQNLLKELCMQVAAAAPRWVSRDLVPPEILDE